MTDFVRVRSKDNPDAVFSVARENVNDSLTVVDDSPGQTALPPEYRDVIELPDGDPTDKWTKDQLAEWTTRAGIQVDGSTKKDFLKSIEDAANATPTNVVNQPVDGNAGDAGTTQEGSN